MSDTVNHPKHYQTVPNVECIEVVRHFNFNLGNVIKYIWRAGHKEGTTALEDLRKAAWYLQDEIERREKREVQPTIVNPEPNWSLAPKWAEWWAIDANGSAFYYDKEPLRGPTNTVWIPNGTDYKVLNAANYPIGTYDWKASKRRRTE